MKKYLLILMIFFLPAKILAAELLKVSISPLVIYAPQISQKMGEEIAEKLSQKIISPEIKVFPWKGKTIPQKIDQARKEGEKQGLDYVVIGSLTQVGEKMSLDLFVIETGGIRPPVPILSLIHI